MMFALFLAAAAPFTVVTASSTNDAPAACLLEGAAPPCTWRATADAKKDAGVDEGVGFRFAEPLACERLEITFRPVDGLASEGPPVHASFGAQSVELARGDDVERWSAPCLPSKTLFLRVRQLRERLPIEITAVRFLAGGKPMVPVLPKAAKATVTASSVLEPKAAYQPAFLFDSKPDLAWAGDGKKGDGKGTVIEVTFHEPQEIAGVVVWNGYQRSPAHFAANSRVAQLSVNAGGKSARASLDASASAEQRHTFAPLPPSKDVELVVDAVKAGDKYKDLVVSELRFLDKSGRILAPQVAVEKPVVPRELAALLDRSYAGAVGGFIGAYASNDCINRRVRVRSGGSFVIYTGDVSGEQGAPETSVIEGGWEQSKKAPSTLRIFGKKYRTVVSGGEYDRSEAIVPEIFQSELSLVPFASLSPAEQTKLLDVVFDIARGGGERGAWDNERSAFGRNGDDLAGFEKSWPALRAGIAKALVAKQALAARSSVYSDVLLPTDAAGQCDEI